MVDQSARLDKIRLMFDSPKGDVTHAHEIYHADAVLEFRSRANASKASTTSRSGAASTRPT